MKKWFYTDDIHDNILINKQKFQLNTSYDNIFKLFHSMNNKNNVETFLKIMFFNRDYEKLKQETNDWSSKDYIDLINYITEEYIIEIDSNFENTKTKYSDIYKDSEKIFTSFYYDYGISLIEKKGKMTWKEFLMLYNDLSEDSPLGKLVKITRTPDKDLTDEGKRLKRERISMLNENITIDNQIDNLAKFLKATAKRDK